MTAVLTFRPLLVGTHQYDKSLSTRGRGAGTLIEAPLLAYLIETRNGRILYDVGCDHRKITDPVLRAKFYDNPGFAFGPPTVTGEQRLPNRLARLGLSPADIDCVICGHLHFDHAGGLHEFAHCEVHVHARELAAAAEPADSAYFASDFLPVDGGHAPDWKVQDREYALTDGVDAVETPGHTAGHLSLLVELPKGSPVLLCGDAADLLENLRDEIAPGLCHEDRPEKALASIRKLKKLAIHTGADLWPNHDMDFFRSRDRFPGYHS
ncbi:MAG: N-acyl homoserine lactonase family protein [Pseudomonadota bacterium]